MAGHKRFNEWYEDQTEGVIQAAVGAGLRHVSAHEPCRDRCSHGGMWADNGVTAAGNDSTALQLLEVNVWLSELVNAGLNKVV